MQLAHGPVWMSSGRVRRAIATAVARGSLRASSLGGHHGTALPGYLAERIDPTILPALGQRVAPVVLVIGANGKTTTTRLIATILERAIGTPVVTNRSGANLRQGIISALLQDRHQRGRWQPAVLEVDELAFRSVARDLRPTVVVILNLVRDQLDRYGEIDTVVDRWTQDLAALPAGAALVTCADDPRVEALARAAGRRTVRFGLRAEPPAGAVSSPDRMRGLEPIADARPCPECGSPVETAAGSAAVGPWRCPTCHLERPRPDLEAHIESEGSGWLTLGLDGPLVRGPSSRPTEPVRVRLAGIAGAHDVAAAVLTAIVLGVDPRLAVTEVDQATPAFGRFEELEVDDRQVVLTLAKNPASLAAAAAAVVSRRPDGLLIGLADRAADGRDVSWIWDAPLDRLPEIAPTTLTGSRADDLALRFKYSLRAPTSGARLVVDRVIEHAFDSSLGRVRPGGTLMVLGTYTALLGVRSVLERRGLAPTLPR